MSATLKSQITSFPVNSLISFTISKPVANTRGYPILMASTYSEVSFAIFRTPFLSITSRASISFTINISPIIKYIND